MGEAAHCAGAFIDFMDSSPFAFSLCCVAVVYGILWKLYDIGCVYVNFDSSMRKRELDEPVFFILVFHTALQCNAM